MKETVRVLLNGDFSELRKDWEASSSWPLGEFGVGTLPSDGPDLSRLRELLGKYPTLRATEFVERSYSKKELLTFPLFLLWENGQIDVREERGLTYGPSCPVCGFPTERRRIQPLQLKRSKLPKKDFALTGDWEIVVSERLAYAWETAGLTGASFSPVLVDGQVSQFRLMTIEADLGEKLSTTLRYDGGMCQECGRFEKSYPIHPSKELWIPTHALPPTDILTLNSRLERSYCSRKLLSNRAYRVLSDIKSTGWWVQPVHVE